MKIHEFQAKALLREHGVPTPRGMVCDSPRAAAEAARALGGTVWAVKAQIHAGGRGKGGGVKLARTPQEAEALAAAMLGQPLVTHQTGPHGQVVRRVLVEEGLEIAQEVYLGLVVDRAVQRVCVMASAEGGVDIETVAERSPGRIHRVWIDPSRGLSAEQAGDIARRMDIPAASLPQARDALLGLWHAYDATDAMLVETNPLVVTRGGDVLALDAKMDFDGNALFRHPDIAELRDLDEEDAAEIEASAHGLAYISLEGDIGCLVNGAGLAMATMDIIKLYGGSPANFLDVGGGASTEKVTEAFKIMLRSPGLKAILVNIFGGIMKCDVIATALTEAAKVVHLSVPLVVRLEGTHVDLGRRILADSGLPIINAGNMADAAAKVVAAARGA